MLENPIFPRATIKPKLHYYTGNPTNDHKYKYIGFGHKDSNPGPFRKGRMQEAIEKGGKSLK